MAGSRRSMIYFTDVPSTDGLSKKIDLINIDESNALATGGLPATSANIAGNEVIDKQDYQRIEYRKLYLVGTTAAGKEVRRSIIACDPDNDLVNGEGTLSLIVSTDGDACETVAFEPSGVVGEKRTFFKEEDTGLDDGTP